MSTLETHSKLYKSQAEKYETLNKALDCELNQLKAEEAAFKTNGKISLIVFKESEASFKKCCGCI